MYKDYLDKCMPSTVMRDYLKTVDLASWQTVKLIMYAPVSIYTKLDELGKVMTDAEERADAELIEESRNAIKNIELAVEYLSADGVFTIELNEYNEEQHDSVGYFDCVLGSMTEVQEYIRKDIKVCEVWPDELKWYGLEKWIKDDSGRYVSACSYIIFRDEIIYGMVDPEFSGMDYVNTYNTYSSCDLNLPVPFKAGDILEFNGFPFGPKSHVLILRVGDNRDCCCLQGLALNNSGLWECGAVKHGMVSINYSPKYSYLYSAAIYNGELPAEEKILQEISDYYIAGDENRGDELYERIWSGHKTTEELRKEVFGVAKLDRNNIGVIIAQWMVDCEKRRSSHE